MNKNGVDSKKAGKDDEKTSKQIRKNRNYHNRQIVMVERVVDSNFEKMLKNTKPNQFSGTTRVDENDKLVQLTDTIGVQTASFAVKGSGIALAVVTDYKKKAKIWQKKIAGTSTRLESMTLMAKYIVGQDGKLPLGCQDYVDVDKPVVAKKTPVKKLGKKPPTKTVDVDSAEETEEDNFFIRRVVHFKGSRGHHDSQWMLPSS